MRLPMRPRSPAFGAVGKSAAEHLEDMRGVDIAGSLWAACARVTSLTLTRLSRYAASRRQARARPDAHGDRPARRYRRQPFANRRSTPVGDQCSGASFSHRKHLARRGGFGERNRLGRISPQRDRYCELSRRMREFAEDVLVPWQYRVPARCPAGGRCPQTGSKVRRQVFLIFSEWIARSGCRLRQGICTGAACASE